MENAPVSERLPPDDDIPELPALDFATFVLSIVGSAKQHLGDGPTPDGDEEPNLILARSDIDLLALLLEKTEGNLSGEEERLINQGLYELRMRYMELSMLRKQRELRAKQQEPFSS